MIDRGKILREQSMAVSFLDWVRKASDQMRREIVMHHGRLDEVAFAYFLSRIAVAYSAVTSFVWAHCLGVVSKRTLAKRWSSCNSCPHKVVDLLGVARCEGHKEHACVCPKKTWWKPGTLNWMIRLVNWPCPRGFFD